MRSPCARLGSFRAFVIFALAAWWAACGSAPTAALSTDTRSDALPTLNERIEFLERYVTFRRHYQELWFHISHHDNSAGLVPGPSDTDLEIVATVPASEIDQWTAGTTPAAERPLGASFESARAASANEWFTAPGKVVGLDRAHSLVVYRLAVH